MALKKCKECGKEISSTVSKCPQCGAQQVNFAQGCAGLVGVVIFGWFVYSFLSAPDTPKSPADAAEQSDNDAVSATENNLKSILSSERDLPPDHSAELSIPPSEADRNNPYATDTRKAALLDYKLLRAQTEANVRDMYFAIGCNVFVTNPGAINYFLSEIEMLDQQAQSSQILDQHIPDDLRAAAQDGTKESKTPGACNYWHDHGEQANELHKESQIQPPPD